MKLSVIGHCCHDKVGTQFVLGGSASYAGVIAAQLGIEVTIITSYGKDFLFEDYLINHGINIVNTPTANSTIFENTYSDGIRTQKIHARAANISTSAIENSKDSDIALICPIAQEVDVDIASHFSNNLVAATIQGWLRAWNKNGDIHSKSMDWGNLKGVDIIIMSREDLPDYESQLPNIISAVKTLLVTDGKNGVTYYDEEGKKHYSAYEADEIDATGAGDSFAISFLIKYHETSDLDHSIQYAQAVSSLVIEKQGIHIPSQKAIQKRMASAL